MRGPFVILLEICCVIGAFTPGLERADVEPANAVAIL